LTVGIHNVSPILARYVNVTLKLTFPGLAIQHPRKNK
jgi:hypothetical protein